MDYYADRVSLITGAGSGRGRALATVLAVPGARLVLWDINPDALAETADRVRIHRGRKGERRSLSEDDYAALVTAAHQQLHAPIVLVWDNIRQQQAGRREYVATQIKDEEPESVRRVLAHGRNR